MNSHIKHNRQEAQTAPTKAPQDGCKVVGCIRQGLRTATKACLSGIKTVFNFFWLDDQEIQEDPAAKGQKKNKRKTPIFSRRFVRVCSLFACIILAVFIVGFLKIMGLTPAPKLPGFMYLNVHNANHLKDNMLQPGPRIIYCKNIRLPPPLFESVANVVRSFPPYINRYALDCAARLPSGKNAYERFEVDPDTTVMIMQAHGKKGKPINETLLSNPQMFYSVVVSDTMYALKHVYDINAFNIEIRRCINRRLLVSTDGKKMSLYSRDHSAMLSRMVDTNRLYNLTTWVINNGLYQLNFGESDDAPAETSFSVYCIVPDGNYYMLGYYSGDPFSKAMESFMRNCSTVTKPNRDFKPLNAMPMLENRVIKKNHQEGYMDQELQAKLAELDKEKVEVLEL